VAVIGAGQAGLAIGHALAGHGRRFVILEAGPSVASAWRGRWDTLVLFTPRRYDALPGLAFPGDPDGYPRRDEVVTYLERYAETFALPLAFDRRVRSVTARDGGFVVAWDGGELTADQVVIATGPFQAPYLPPIAGALAPEVFQIHATDYRRPAEVPGRRVAVVGGGNTGFQIAKELSRTHEVHLAVGSRQTPLPQRLFGRDLFWWLTRLGVLEKTVDSRLGRRASRRDTLVGSSPREVRRHHGVQLHRRAVGAEGRHLRLAGGTSLEIDAVIWATGFRPDYSWLEVPVLGADGRPRHRRGVTDVPGLYFLGLSWQHTRGSALLGWVKDDAGFIAVRIAALAGRPRSDEQRGGARKEI
jgi:putative flavoprotein involved in K+ transport